MSSFYEQTVTYFQRLKEEINEEEQALASQELINTFSEFSSDIATGANCNHLQQLTIPESQPTLSTSSSSTDKLESYKERYLEARGEYRQLILEKLKGALKKGKGLKNFKLPMPYAIYFDLFEKYDQKKAKKRKTHFWDSKRKAKKMNFFKNFNFKTEEWVEVVNSQPHTRVHKILFQRDVTGMKLIYSIKTSTLSISFKVGCFRDGIMLLSYI